MPTELSVVRLDYDFWHAIGEADGELAPGEQPALNEEGHLYYLRLKPGWSEGEPFWPDGRGFTSLEAAKAEAEARVPGSVTWR